MAEPDNQPSDAPLNERLLDLFVYVPAGIAVSVVEEFPRFAERGRERLGGRLSSARAVGQFAMKAGQEEFRRRSGALLHRTGPRPTDSEGPRPVPRVAHGVRPVRAGRPFESVVINSDAGAGRPVAAVRPEPNGHIPPVSTLSIPGFDTLSASQVVQRLDGLNRAELVSVRAYEASTRKRRTILSRVDQLLDERS